MKIATFTYHACFNYGACLQAFALQWVIKQKFGNCKIIDYQTQKFVDINHPFCKRPKHAKEVIKNISRLPYIKSLSKRTEYFENFINNVLDLTPRCSCDEDVQKMAEQFDCVVCGSDQIWNLDPSIRYETPLYYMNFPKKQRRVTYATSFGSWVKDFASRESELLPWIREFDKLSMREESGVRLLKSKGFDCDWVLDPTLLLDSETYDKIARERLIEEPYVLLFSWDGAKETIDIAKAISQKSGYKTYYIVPPPRAMFSGIERKLDVGPSEFLSLVKHAEFVVTNSFHGTVFSTIYHKPFVSAIAHEADPRRKSLMSQFGLEDHLMSLETLDIDKIKNTDFAAVEQNLAPLKEKSQEYLYRAIEG